MPYSCFCIVTSHQSLFCSTFVKCLDYKRRIANKIHVYTYFFAWKHLYSLWFVMGNGKCSMIPALVHTASSTLFAHVCGSYWLETSNPDTVLCSCLWSIYPHWLKISNTDTVLCSCLWSIYPYWLEISNIDTILSRDSGVWTFHPSLQKLGGILRNTLSQTWQHFDWALYGPILCTVRCSAVSLISIQ